MDSARERKHARLARAPLALLAATALAASVYGMARALELRVGLHVLIGPFLRLWLALLAIACMLGMALLGRELAALRRGLPQPLAPFGSLALVSVAGWALFLGFAQPFQRVWFDLALGIAAGVWAGLVLLDSRAAQGPPRTIRALCVALALAAPLGELGLRGLAAVHPSPVLARVGEAPRRLIERFRCAPGELRYGFPCNARGFYDDEFRRRGAGEHLVVSIGDSFNVGAVPHARHYTTLCEELLGAPVHNVGVAGIGPTEYLRLSIDEALPLDPELVVVSVFTGNDLDCADVEEGLPDVLLRSWLERERVLLWVVPRRLARIAAEEGRREDRETPIGSAQGERDEPELGAGLEERFPWLADPSREEPTLGEETFLRLETQRALDTCGRDPVAFASFAKALLAARRASAKTAFCVLLIPDEFQVEDALWETVSARAGVALERDRPQRLASAWLAREGIPCLDLLPLLRAVPPLADGERHLYHRRDTHFNARGNRVAGEALADFLRPLLAERAR